MSREIKFRSWVLRDKDGEVDPYMEDMNGVESYISPFDEYREGNIILMQYTGLKDRNGVEIYEGDILRFPPETLLDENSFIGYEVFYHDNDCADRNVGFQMNRMHFYGSLCGGECKGYMLPKYTSRMVIIGNIYENPELIHGT